MGNVRDWKVQFELLLVDRDGIRRLMPADGHRRDVDCDRPSGNTTKAIGTVSSGLVRQIELPVAFPTADPSCHGQHPAHFQFVAAS
jgi:hypothetical protein